MRLDTHENTGLSVLVPVSDVDKMIIIALAASNLARYKREYTQLINKK